MFKIAYCKNTIYGYNLWQYALFGKVLNIITKAKINFTFHKIFQTYFFKKVLAFFDNLYYYMCVERNNPSNVPFPYNPLLIIYTPLKTANGSPISCFTLYKYVIFKCFYYNHYLTPDHLEMIYFPTL